MKEYITIEEINNGYLDCCKHKQGTNDCVRYQMNHIQNNLQLYKDLNNMTYTIGKSKAFCVTRPKLREVFCAQFRDRIVHHILENKFEGIFEKELTDYAFACRKKKGVEYGINKVKKQIEVVSENYTKETWILKCDLQGFFMSIDRSMLYSLISNLLYRNYKGDNIEFWLWLWKLVIMNDPAKNCVRVGDLSLWSGLVWNKSLFTCGEGRGLPIGNLPSQWLANLLLSNFDRMMIKRLVDN